MRVSRFTTSLLSCGGVLAACLTAAPAAAQQKTCVLGIISPKHPGMIKDAYEPIRTYLEQESGCKITLDPVLTYPEGIERMKAKRWSLAFATNETYLEAKPYGYRALAMVTERGLDYYYSILVVPADSPIKSLAQLKGKKIAFVSKKSASGYIYPMKLLLDNGVSPAGDLKISFTGNARIIGNTIANPNKTNIAFDVGAVYDGYLNENPVNARRLRVLAKSEPIPHIPVVAGPDVVADPMLFGKFRDALLKINTPGSLQLTPSSAVFFDGFKLPSEKLYEKVRVVNEQIRRYEAKHPIPDEQ